MEFLRTDTVGEKEDKMNKGKKGHEGLMRRVMEATRIGPELDSRVAFLDQLLDPLLVPEKIAKLTEFFQNQGYLYREKEIEQLIVALEFLFHKEEIGIPDEDELVVFRKHLIHIYQECKKKKWGAFWESDRHDNAKPFRMKLLEKIIKGWQFKSFWDPDHRRAMLKDGPSCFSFVCGVYRDLEDHYAPEMKKAIEELFRKQIEHSWNFEELTPWILRAPEQIAVVLLKQRTRLGAVELIPELRLLKNFDIQNRSEEAIAFVAEKMKAAKQIEETAEQFTERLLAKKVKGLDDAEYNMLDEKTAIIHILLGTEKKKKQALNCLEIAEAAKKERDEFVKETGTPYRLVVKVTGPGFEYQDPNFDLNK